MNNQQAQIITGRERIRCVQITAQIGALKLEALGMKSRGGSLRSRIGVSMGLGTRVKHAVLISRLEEERAELHKLLGL